MGKIFNHSKLIIIIIFIITAFFAFQLPKIKINNEVDIFLPENHPSRIAKDKMEDIYGSSEAMVIAINVKKGTILDKKNITMIQNLTEELEDIENVDEVTSLTNADYIDGTAEGMEVSPLAEAPQQTDSELLDIKRKLISWNLYKGNLYNEDFKASQIMIKLKPDIEITAKEKIYFDVKEILKGYERENIDFYLAGSPAVTVLMGNNMEGDLARLIPFVILVVLISLYLSFKNVSGVVLPTMTVVISTIWALGIMAMLGINLTMVSTVIPVLLVAVGSAYGIHIISHYYDEIKANMNEDFNEEVHHKIVLYTVKKVGKAVVLAGITTIVGFGSLATSSIMPIKNFGIFTAVGVATALVVAILLIPAILIVRHKKVKYNNSRDEEGTLTKILIALYHYFSEKRVRILVLTFVTIIISVMGTSKIVIDNILVEMFKEKTEIRQADKFANNNLNGTNVLNVLIKGREEGSLTNPEILKEMDELGVYLKHNFNEVGKVTSFADFIKRMNKVMNYPQEELVSKDQAEVSNFGKETTSSFGEETTSDFEKETTSNFGEETTSSFGQETTSDFGEETTSSFGQEDNSSQATKVRQLEIKEPSKQEISERDLVVLLNQAIIKAKRLNLTAEELVELVNKELNYKGEAYNEIPYDPSKYPVEKREGLKNLISQYLLLYSGSLDDLINDQLEPSKARMMIQMKTASNITTKKVKKAIIDYASRNFPEGYEVSIAGTADMSLAVNNLIVSSQIKSILLSLIVVFIIVAISYRSLIAGIFGIVPLSISLLINFGLMGFLGIKLDIGTAMVASIAIGIGVDYTIHFLSTYNHERIKTDNLEVVTKKTLLSSGKAIIFNAVSVAAGFAVLLFSNFNPLVNLGLLVSITMVTSSVASMTVLPVLLNIFKPKFISNKGMIDEGNDSLVINQ
ncbi:MMPL family transporter [Orenia marismortui]|uniref:MMPL family transporter n=1 Tax=Orenia marismortui TaxID=46469 RepID=UPI00036EF5AC|nr:MMPL family transporter [Orenia marismortui]